VVGVRRWCGALFPRAEASAAESAANLEICFAPDAPPCILNFFAGLG
jgi:hypothetical protein